MGWEKEASLGAKATEATEAGSLETVQWAPIGNIKGQGVPTGGAAGQMLAKTSDVDYDSEWIDPPTGSVVSVNGVTPDESGSVVLTADTVGADAAGQATSALMAAQTYADSKVEAERVRADAAYDSANAAASALTASQAYTDTKVSDEVSRADGAYDPVGSAQAAQEASLQKSANLDDVADPAVALSNLGAAPLASGVPEGGSTGQVLTKASDADRDLTWADGTPKGILPPFLLMGA